MQADLSEIRVRLKEHPELVRQMTDSAITLSDPDEILQNLQVQIQDDFPALTDTSYTLKYVPEALESSLVPGLFPRTADRFRRFQHHLHQRKSKH